MELTNIGLAPRSHQCVTNLFCDVRLLHRIALPCVDALSSTGFSLCGLGGGSSILHRLKPVLLDRTGPAPSLVEVNPARNFYRVHETNAD